MTYIVFFRTCPWPRDSSEVLELSDAERLEYLYSKNADTITINGVDVAGFYKVNNPNIPTSALNYQTKITADPAIINYYSYAVVVDNNDGINLSYWWYWVDKVEVVKRDKVTRTAITSVVCSCDLWSQYGNMTTLYNSVVANQTVDRWTKDDRLPIYRPSQEHVNGTMGVLRTYIFRDYVYNEYIFAAKYFIQYAVVYATKKVNGSMVMVTGLIMGVYYHDNGKVTKSDQYQYFMDSNGVKCKMVPFESLYDGSLYSYLNVGANNSTVLNVEILPPLGLGLIQDDYISFGASTNIQKINLDNDKDYWMVDLTKITGFQGYPIFGAPIELKIDFPHPTKPGLDPDYGDIYIGMPYRDFYEPINYQSPYQYIYLTTVMGDICGQYDDECILRPAKYDAWVKPPIAPKHITVRVCYDASATCINLMLGSYQYTDKDTDSNDLSSQLLVKGGVSIAGLKANVIDDQKIIYRNTQYNADRELRNVQQITGAIQGIAGLASAIGGGFANGGPAGAAAAGGGAGIGIATGFINSEAQWKHDQTIIENKPNTVLFSGGFDYPYRVGGGWMLVQTRIDDLTWRAACAMHYLTGISINETVIGTINLHQRVGFDYIKCNYARIKLNAPSEVQLAIKQLFEAGIRIYHRIDFFEQDKTDIYQCMENFEVSLLPEPNNDNTEVQE